jgi:hypothetical protein
MADQDYCSQNFVRQFRQRAITLLVAVIIVYAFTAIAYGQERPAERRQQTTTTTTTTAQPTATDRVGARPGQLPTDETAPVNGDDRDAKPGTEVDAADDEARGVTTNAVGEGFTNPNLEADSERTAQRRKKPEQPAYFIAQYATRYDDNVTFDVQDRRRDIVFMPQIGFGLMKVSSRGSIRVDYRGGGEFYRQNSMFTGMLNSVSVNAEYDLSRRTTITFNNFFLSRPNPARLLLIGGVPVINTGAVNLNGALTQLIATRTTFNSSSIGFIHQTSRHSSIYANATYAFNNFSNRALLDSAERTLELGYSRRTKRVVSYDLIYRLSGLQSGGSSLSNSFLPAFTFQRNKQMRLRVGIGPQYVTAANGGGKLFWSALADFTYVRSRYTTIAVSYTAGVGQGGGLGTTRNHTVIGTVSRAFGRWQTEFRSGYSRATSANLGLANLLAGGGANNQLIMEGQVAYPLADKVAVFLDYSHSRQFGFGNTRNIFSVGFNFDTRRTSRDRDLRMR